MRFDGGVGGVEFYLIHVFGFLSCTAEIPEVTMLLLPDWRRVDMTMRLPLLVCDNEKYIETHGGLRPNALQY